MTSITIQDLDQELEAKLRSLAVKNGRSIEDEARQILHRALGNNSVASPDFKNVKEKSETEK